MSRWEDGQIWYTPQEWEARERLREQKRRRMLEAFKRLIETSADPPESRQPRHPPEEPTLWVDTNRS